MGPAAAWAVPAGVGLIGSLMGSNQQSQAANAAQQQASQSAAAQQQINQQLMGIYNSLFQDYQTNYQPLEAGQSAAMGGVQNATAGVPGNLETFLQSLMNPGAIDARTGIPTQAATQDIFSYFAQPQNTNANAAGNIALRDYLNPDATMLARSTPGILGQQQTGASAAASGLPFLTNPGASPVAQQAPSTLSYLNSPGTTNLAGVSPDILAYLMNPGGTNLAAATPGAQSLFSETAAHGLSPDVISQALQQNDVAAQRAMSDVQERGGALPNVSGTIKDITGQEFAGNADLLAKLAAQSQMLKLSGAQAGLGAAQALDTQHGGMLAAAPGVAGGLDTQTMGMLTAALQAAGYTTDQIAGLFGQAATTGNTLSNIAGAQGATAGAADQQKASLLGLGVQTAGGMDQQTSQMLMQALGIGQGASTTALNNMGTANTAGMNAQQLIQQYINSGKPQVGAATQGMGAIGAQYGAGASQAASNAAAASSQNPFASFATTLAGLNYGGSKPAGTTTAPAAAPAATSFAWPGSWPTVLPAGQLN